MQLFSSCLWVSSCLTTLLPQQRCGSNVVRKWLISYGQSISIRNTPLPLKLPWTIPVQVCLTSCLLSTLSEMFCHQLSQDSSPSLFAVLWLVWFWKQTKLIKFSTHPGTSRKVHKLQLSFFFIFLFFFLIRKIHWFSMHFH